VAAGHPGHDGTKPRQGNIDPAWIKFVDRNSFKIEFPNGSPPGSFIGNAVTPTTCPVDVDVAFNTCFAILGSAGGGFQKLVVNPNGPQCMGNTCCHELGHSMGQTVMPSSVTFKSLAYRGGTAPSTVPAGDVYDGHDHVGTHCAKGLTVAQKGQASYNGNGMIGRCIMFGSGGVTDPPPGASYCAECIKQIKGRKLHDIVTSYGARNADDL
jgi:hypothetical protein